MESFDKTEQPTLKKISSFRKKGDVPFSPLFARTFHLALMWLLILQANRLFVSAFSESMRGSFQILSLDPAEGMKKIGSLWIFPLTLFFALSFLVLITSPLLQRGWIWAKPERKMGFFSGQKGEKWIIFLKFICLGIAAFFTCKFFFIRFTQNPFLFSSGLLFQSIMTTSGWILFSFLVLGMIDWIGRVFAYRKRLLMSRQELKDEKRETEGNVQVKRSMKKRKIVSRVAK